ncbi:hypothetical protein NKJ70_05865 [Mesorhizobium sp. M0092]|uniref:hypothetical protein n=1 Tax=Mesorhizobium sp. M0092 TaxID=2956876 RepID=UPI003338C33E
MTIFETTLTEANVKQEPGRHHIYITPFRDQLPKDVFGGPSQHDKPRCLVRLEFGALRTDTFVPSYQNGKPRTFFQDRWFVGEFFSRTDAQPGEMVLFEQISLYHYRLAMRKLDGTVVTA